MLKVVTVPEKISKQYVELHFLTIVTQSERSEAWSEAVP